MNNLKLVLATCLMIGQFACSSGDSNVELSVNMGIPVKTPVSSSKFTSKSLSNLMNVTIGQDCYQNNIYLGVRDTLNNKLISTQKVMLRTKTSSTYTFGNTSADIGLAIGFLQNYSFLDEPLKVMVPKNRKVNLELMGNLVQPKDYNQNGICDERKLDLGTYPTRYEKTYITQKSSISTTESPNHLVDDHTATLLKNGKILVVGGHNFDVSTSTDVYYNSAQLYDPETNAWTDAGVMSFKRRHHTASLLPNGKVLVAGGFGCEIISPNTNCTSSPGYLDSIEIYDPNTNSWSPLAPMSVPRQLHTATVLSDGRVVFIGGDTGSGGTGVVEIYNPDGGGSVSVVGSLDFARFYHTATLLPNGKIIVFGGTDGISSYFSHEEFFDTKNSFDHTPPPLPPHGLTRSNHTATLVGNKVYFIGGTTLTEIDVYDSSGAGSWDTSNSKLNFALDNSQRHTANLLPSGKIMIVGGHVVSPSSFTNKVQYIDTFYSGVAAINSLASNDGINALAMNDARAEHTATLLPNGKVMVIGGVTDALDTHLSSVEEIEYAPLALHSTNLAAVVPIDSNALSAGKIDLNINLLHANPTAAYTGYNSSWVGFDSFFPTPDVPGQYSARAYLNKIGWFMDQNQFSLINNVLSYEYVPTTQYFLPKHYPYRVQFVFRAFYQYAYAGGLCVGSSHSGDTCSGTYEALITGPTISGQNITAYLIKNTAGGSLEPPASITGAFNAH